MNDPRFEVYPQRHADHLPDAGEPTGEYGWRFRSRNGQISGIGGEGFSRREDANRAIHDFLDEVTGIEPHPPIIDVED